MKKLSRFLKGSVPNSVNEMLTLGAAWPEIVGKQNSQICMPVKLVQGKLTVAVLDNIYIQGLTFIKEEMIEKLVDAKVPVSDIHFVFKPIYVKPKKKKIKRKITEQEKGFITRLSSQIEDSGLRESYERALTAYFHQYSLNDFLDVEKGAN